VIAILFSRFFSANTKRLNRRRNSKQAISRDTVPFQCSIQSSSVVLCVCSVVLSVTSLLFYTESHREGTELHKELFYFWDLIILANTLFHQTKLILLHQLKNWDASFLVIESSFILFITVEASS
jgi:hypothetical protein